MREKKNRPEKRATAHANAPNGEYRVGPGRPPKEFQFKAGQSGNPKGARRKTSATSLDFKAALQRSLRGEVKLKQGDRERNITKAAAGIEQLVNQFARGDRYARRDLFGLVGELGMDLTAGENETIEQTLEAALTANDEAIIENYIQRHLAERNQSDDSEPGASEVSDPQESDKPTSNRSVK
jgi:hypothetical protein